MGPARWSVVVVLTVGLLPAPPAQAVAPLCDGRAATIVGTPGDDHITGTPGADVIVGLGGRDRIDGRGGADRICGGGGPDTLRGGEGRDRLFGQENGMYFDRGGTHVLGDVLDGGTGDDLLDLGAPAPASATVNGERIEFLTAPGAVVVDLRAGTATGQGDDVVPYVRRMSVRTGEGDDTILGTRLGESVDAGPGNDTIVLRGGPDTVRERRTALPDDDVVDTGAGQDVVRATSGADRISTGGAHDDVSLTGRGPFTVDAGGGEDWVFAQVTDRPGASYDLGEIDDTDQVLGGDYLSFAPAGSAVPDRALPLRVDVPAHQVVVTVAGTPVPAAISGVERYAFFAGLAVDFLGGPDAESLEGPSRPALHAVMGAGDDTVFGTMGPDHIDGGDGVDVASGGDGDDTCVRVEEPSSC